MTPHSLLTRLKPLLLPAYFLAWVVYFLSFWLRAFRFDLAGNLYANHVNIWGDWAVHFTMGSSMAFKDLWLTQSPLLLGERFSYPFANNFISALLIRGGMPFLWAFIVPSLLCSLAMVAALYFFFKTVFKAKKIAIIASLIFLLNGGLGFVYFAQDIAASPTPLTTLINPPHEYTRIDDEGIKWLSVIDSMMIPQRAFALGFPLTVIAITLIYQVFFQTESLKKPHKATIAKLLAAAVILGWMPIIHTHSFLAAGIILSCWMLADLLTHRRVLLERLGWWAVLGIVTLVFAAPLFYYYFYNQVGGFIKWYPGWLAREYAMPWLTFWVKNWALTPLLAVMGYWAVVNDKVSQGKHKFLQYLPTIVFFAPFLLLFILSNLFLFQPFSWDNTKLIVWSALGFSGLTAYLLVTRAKNWLSTAAVGVLFVITILSGTIDAYWIQRTSLHSYMMYSAEELTLAQWAVKSTSPDSIWLTGTQHNHWLYNLTGRQPLMAFPGWLWTHGYDYLPVQNHLRTMFQYPERYDLFQRYGIEYVVIGWQEKSEYNANLRGYEARYPLVQKTEAYSIFDVTQPPKVTNLLPEAGL